MRTVPSNQIASRVVVVVVLRCGLDRVCARAAQHRFAVPVQFKGGRSVRCGKRNRHFVVALMQIERLHSVACVDLQLRWPLRYAEI
jgi:hypothetical protein